jgi:hypothetical protein
MCGAISLDFTMASSPLSACGPHVRALADGLVKSKCIWNRVNGPGTRRLFDRIGPSRFVTGALIVGLTGEWPLFALTGRLESTR